MESVLGSLAGGLAVAAILLVPHGMHAQPLNERTPNLEGTWVGEPHQLFFQFSHRFQIAGTEVDIGDLFGDGKVVNYPTFGLAYGILPGAAVGVRYSSNSLVAGSANEWQPYVKLSSSRSAEPPLLSGSLLAAWNAANRSVDGELAAQARLDRVRLIAALRGYSSPFDRPAEEAGPELALAAGAVLALNRHLSVGADYGIMVTEPDVQVAWSAAVSARIPYTPHTLAFFATNVTSGTLQGLSVGVDRTTYWGFEFTVPFSGHRWGRIFDPDDPRGTASAERPPSEAPAGPAPAPRVVEISIQDLEFQDAEITVTPGTTVRWVNRDPLAHTTTAEEGAWESPLLEEGEAFEHTFREPGTYPYYCKPHPFMKGVVRVRAESRP